MFVRVVRFTDVTRDRVQKVVERIEAPDGPPPGVDTIEIKLMFDEVQGTAVVLQYFESAEAMKAAEQAMSAMDPSETPGTRASVDACELALERTII